MVVIYSQRRCTFGGGARIQQLFLGGSEHHGFEGGIYSSVRDCTPANHQLMWGSFVIEILHCMFAILSSLSLIYVYVKEDLLCGWPILLHGLKRAKRTFNRKICKSDRNVIHGGLFVLLLPTLFVRMPPSASTSATRTGSTRRPHKALPAASMPSLWPPPKYCQYHRPDGSSHSR